MAKSIYMVSKYSNSLEISSNYFCKIYRIIYSLYSWSFDLVLLKQL